MALASCTTSVYVNLSKNSLMPFGLDFFHDSENQVNLFFSCCSRSSFQAKRPKIGRKRMQRYEEFQYHPNFFNKKFPKIQRFSGMLTNKSYTLFIIYRTIRVVRRFWGGKWTNLRSQGTTTATAVWLWQPPSASIWLSTPTISTRVSI